MDGRRLHLRGERPSQERTYASRKRFGIPSTKKGGPSGYAGILEYERRLKEQGGGCAICSRPPKRNKRLCVDHNHRTGLVRGLLCSVCNGRLLGRLERFRGWAT